MKLKTLLLALLVVTGSSIFAQIKVDVFINGKLGGQYEIKKDQTTGGGISYKRKDYRTVDKLSVELKGKSVDGGYIRTLEINDAGGKNIAIAKETQGVKGQFTLTESAAVLKKLKKGTPLTLVLVKTPANTKSTEAVSKVYAGTLSRS
jgi:hypothetical protein